jgi:hypothetical protein
MIAVVAAVAVAAAAVTGRRKRRKVVRAPMKLIKVVKSMKVAVVVGMMMIQDDGQETHNRTARVHAQVQVQGQVVATITRAATADVVDDDQGTRHEVADTDAVDDDAMLLRVRARREDTADRKVGRGAREEADDEDEDEAGGVDAAGTMTETD